MIRVLVAGVNGGQRILNSCSHAFKELGCNVIEYDYYEKFLNKQHLYLPYLGDVTEKINYIAINRDLINIAKEFRPDFILLIKCNPIFPSTIKFVQTELNVKVYNWNPDNPFNRLNTNRLHKNSIRFLDGYFIWGKYLIDQLLRFGAREAYYLPFCFDPRFFRPIYDIKEEDKINDVVFIGTWERKRELILEKLVDYRLFIWGNSWENLKSGSPLKRCLVGKAIYADSLAETYVKSKIILNFVREQNGDAQNFRTFEVPACRQFLLTTRTKEQLEFFGEGREIECFDNVDELREKIDYYLDRPKLREEIAHNAYIKNQPNTFKDRMSQILDIFQRT